MRSFLVWILTLSFLGFSIYGNIWLVEKIKEHNKEIENTQAYLYNCIQKLTNPQEAQKVIKYYEYQHAEEYIEFHDSIYDGQLFLKITNNATAATFDKFNITIKYVLEDNNDLKFETKQYEVIVSVPPHKTVGKYIKIYFPDNFKSAKVTEIKPIIEYDKIEKPDSDCLNNNLPELHVSFKDYFDTIFH